MRLFRLFAVSTLSIVAFLFVAPSTVSTARVRADRPAVAAATWSPPTDQDAPEASGAH